MRSKKAQRSPLQSLFFIYGFGVLLLCVCGCNSQEIDPLGALQANSDPDDYFGYSVSTSGDTIVVGAPYEDSDSKGVNGNQNNGAIDSGAAYVFVRDGTSWIQQAYLKASNTERFDYFGYSVSISEDTIVVGAVGEDSDRKGVNADQLNDGALESGAAYVFVRNGTRWTQQAYLKASNTERNDSFGHAVGISGDTIVVGAPYEDSDSHGMANNGALDAGAVYVYVRNATTWRYQAYIKASNTERWDYFGCSVSISGDTIVVGAYGEDSDSKGVNGDQSNDGALDSGAAYVYVRNGTTWRKQAYIKAMNTERWDYFGYSVSISGDTIVVGAIGEDSERKGVDGDQLNDGARDSGAAYVYVRNETRWVRQAYLKATNTERNDSFGCSVSISGDIIVVGAYLEDSDAIGVDGDELNDDLRDSGAAYVYVRDERGWLPREYLKANTALIREGFFGSAVAVDEQIVVGQYNGNSAYVFGKVITTTGTTGTTGTPSYTNTGTKVNTGESSVTTGSSEVTTGADRDLISAAVTVHALSILSFALIICILQI